MIKDSGIRCEFSSGAVRDIQEGKGRCDLLPLTTIGNLMNDTVFHFLGGFETTGDQRFLLEAIRSSTIFPDLPTMILEVSKHFEEGSKKYSPNNWKKGIPVSRYIDSGCRHYLKHLRGDTDEPHDRAFCWNLLCAAWTCENKPELNDYAKQGVDEE